MSCIKCSIAKSQSPAKIVYEDAVCIAYIPAEAAATGHVQVIPKQHVEAIEELPDDIIVQLFSVASCVASAVYEGIAAQGTNIICNNGTIASNGHFSIHVLPRKEKDNLSFQWQPKQISNAEIDEVLTKIKDKADVIGFKKGEEKEVITQTIPTTELPETDEKARHEEKEPETISKEEENYLVKHLYKIP